MSKEYKCINNYVMNEPKGSVAFIKGKTYFFDEKRNGKSELFENHDMSDESDFDEYFKEVLEKPLTEPMKSIEEVANELFPLVDTLPRETGYHENDVSEKQQEAFIKGYELANSQTTNHLKKLIEEVKFNLELEFRTYNGGNYVTSNAGQEVHIVDKLYVGIDKQSIDQVLKEYLTNNEL